MRYARDGGNDPCSGAVVPWRSALAGGAHIQTHAVVEALRYGQISV